MAYRSRRRSSIRRIARPRRRATRGRRRVSSRPSPGRIGYRM